MCLGLHARGVVRASRFFLKLGWGIDFGYIGVGFDLGFGLGLGFGFGFGVGIPLVASS